ncbi:MAG: hypothetical protein GX352_05530 [Clostridiales bacterium]|nr:hypothetical protein [Clostridiales bacterium]
MQIFYFRKKRIKWVVAVIVIVVLGFIIWRLLGAGSQQSEETLMIAHIVRMNN